MLARLARMLRRGGQCYIEDLYQGAPFATSDLYDVHQTIFGVTLTSIADYVRDLHEAGFTGIMATALSDDWAAFCGGAAAWQADRPRHVRVHGEPIYTQLDMYSAVVLRLFDSGSLGVYAWSPARDECAHQGTPGVGVSVPCNEERKTLGQRPPSPGLKKGLKLTASRHPTNVR